MNKETAIKLATEFQRERHASLKISKVHRIDQRKIDAFVEAAGKDTIEDWPNWMRPCPHWVVLFDRQTNMTPTEDVICVYDDGSVLETPPPGRAS